jgi:hypothetical protein
MNITNEAREALKIILAENDSKGIRIFFEGMG